MSSPWERVIGAQTSKLHPALRQYFGAIPAGHVGRGSGVFTSVGSPRRRLWPVLAALSLEGIAFPAWEHEVAFDVENRPTHAGTVRSRRTFHLAAGDRVMVDEIGVTAVGLVDRLGESGLIDARLRPEIVDGGLELVSTSVVLRLGVLRVPLGALSPRVVLTERWHDERQHVSIVITAPVIGRLYEYSGSFSYRIERDD